MRRARTPVRLTLVRASPENSDPNPPTSAGGPFRTCTGWLCARRAGSRCHGRRPGHILQISLRRELLVGSAEPACDALHWIDDPDAFEAEPTAQAWDSQVLRLARRIPIRWASRPVPLVSLHYMTSPTTGSRSTTAPHWPASPWPLDQRQPSPKTLLLPSMAALVQACESGHDHVIVLFSGPFTKNEINLGHYSRLRQPHAESAKNAPG